MIIWSDTRHAVPISIGTVSGPPTVSICRTKLE